MADKGSNQSGSVSKVNTSNTGDYGYSAGNANAPKGFPADVNSARVMEHKLQHVSYSEICGKDACGEKY